MRMTVDSQLRTQEVDNDDVGVRVRHDLPKKVNVCNVKNTDVYQTGGVRVRRAASDPSKAMHLLAGHSFVTHRDNKMAVLATAENMGDSCGVFTLYMDGTLKSAPRIFAHMYIIRGLLTTRRESLAISAPKDNPTSSDRILNPHSEIVKYPKQKHQTSAELKWFIYVQTN